MKTPSSPKTIKIPAGAPRSRRISLAILATVLTLGPVAAYGADLTWNNTLGQTDWGSASNWSGSVTRAPNSSDQAIFTGVAVANPLINGQTTANSLRFGSAANGYLISGTGATPSLRLNNSNAISAVAGSGANEIAIDLLLGTGAGNTATISGVTGGSLHLSGKLSSVNAISGVTFNNAGGTTILSGQNSYSGTTTAIGGTLHLNHANAISQGSLRVNNATISNSSGAAITLAHNNDFEITSTVNNALTFTSVAGTGDLSIGSGRVIATRATSHIIVTNAGSTLRIGHLDADVAGRNITIGSATSAGKLSIASAAGSNVTGTFRLIGGVLEVASGSAFGSGLLQIEGGARLDASLALTGANVINNLFQLTGNATIGGNHDVTLSNTFTGYGGSHTLTVNNTHTRFSADDFYLSNGSAGYTFTLNGTGNVTIDGDIANNPNNTNNARLIYSGTGALTLNGANRYTGGTTVSSGRLVVNGSLGAGAVSVASGASLAGVGSIGGNTTIEGTLSPGNSPGTLTFDGGLTLATGATYWYEGGDGTEVGGALTLQDDWVLTLAGAGFADGGSTVLFSFGSLVNGADLTPLFDLTHLEISLSGPLTLERVGNTLVLNGITSVPAIPEPSTLGIALSGLVAALLWRRRTRSRA